MRGSGGEEFKLSSPALNSILFLKLTFHASLAMFITS